MIKYTFGSSHIYAVCLAVKYKSGRFDSEEFSSIVSNFLISSSVDVHAYFLGGIFLAARDILFINDGIIKSIDNTIKNLDEDKFIEVVSNFRYAFMNLSPIEIERLSEIIACMYGAKKDNIMDYSNNL